MSKARLAGALALLAVCLAAAWHYLNPRPAVPEAAEAVAAPSKTPLQPDQQSQPLAAENSSASGIAPGFSPAAGEVEDKITVMTSPSRVLVRAPDEKTAPPQALMERRAPDPAVMKIAPLHGSGDEITPLNVRDPSALVLPPDNESINGDDTPPPPKTRRKRPAAKKAQ